MKITLLRHGKPDFNVAKRMTGKEMKNASQGYDAAEIVSDSIPPSLSMDMAHHAKVIVCSHLLRSRQSAQKLTQKKIAVSDVLFGEADLPYLNIAYPKLSMTTWAVLLRVLWILGYAKNAESITSTRQRAGQAAARLIETAQQHQHVLLVGHAIFNYFIAKELKKQGWIASKKSPKKHWEYTTYKIQT
jgi:broad specificity phosphatase PhoE